MSTSPTGARRLPMLRHESAPKAPEGASFAPFGPRPASADITSRLVALKARIFCEGLRIDDDLWRELSHEHHYRHKRAGLSQGRFFRLVDGDASTAVNAPVHEPFVKKSSLELRRGEGGTYRIHDADGDLCEAVPFAWPKWYERTCDDGTPMSLVVSAHCDTSLYSALYQGGCDYWQGDMMCQFCAMKVDQKSKWRDVSIIAEVCKVALEENADAEITLGGGTRLFPDKSAKHKAEGIAKLKSMVDIPVCVEMAAPDTDDWLDRLKDAGLASILMNLELWDEDVRRRVMPGKAAITRQRYLDALGYAAKILGPDQVSSQIIIGLEPVEDTLAAVRAVADVGAIPLPVVFRPLPGTALADVPTPPLAEVLAVFDETLAQMKRRTLDGAKTRSGCALCGACSAHR
ncbi:MAG: radical SAM protein [Polyangiaceae bacterium]